MKRFAVKMLAAVLLMAVSAIGLAQDNQNGEIAAAVQALCGENVQVLSGSACGSTTSRITAHRPAPSARAARRLTASSQRSARSRAR